MKTSTAITPQRPHLVSEVYTPSDSEVKIVVLQVSYFSIVRVSRRVWEVPADSLI